MEAIYMPALDLEELAKLIIATRDEVSYIDTNDILFFKEINTHPKSLARTYSFVDSLLEYFTKKPFAIIFFEANIDYMTLNQRKMLMLHELMHIPLTGPKLIDHTVKDFPALLHINNDWNREGQDVPDILVNTSRDSEPY